jgi:predicted nucleotidyltransferase
VKVKLELSEQELSTVRAILRRHLASNFKVYAFGSRAGGRVKPWSDLDLSIEGGEPVPLATLGALADEFDESDLIWKVDLVDRATVSEAFGKIIDTSKIPLI